MTFWAHLLSGGTRVISENNLDDENFNLASTMYLYVQDA